MDNTNELLLRIDPQTPRITVETMDEGVTAFKEISVNVLYDCIRRSIRSEAVASGLLPMNCLSVNIDSDGNRYLCLRHPQLRADISYFGTEYKNFPLPRLVFGFRVSAVGKVFGCRLGVIKDELPTEDTPMYVYPFSNVSGFQLCTGNNVLPSYEPLRKIATLPFYLLSLPNNNDSYHKTDNKLGLDYRELLHHLKDKEPAYYYSDILLPNNKTLKDFISEGRA